MPVLQSMAKPGGGEDITTIRYEAKYIIRPDLVPRIRDFLRFFCIPDPHGRGQFPEYSITTLQLDAPNLALHHAKEEESLIRFKLRARRYDAAPAKTFMEIKQKHGAVVGKRRARVTSDAWSEALAYGRRSPPPFVTAEEEEAYFEFVRLTRSLGAQPVALVRYVRESYIGTRERYARLTFDRRLQYQATRSWTDWGAGGRWRSMDTGEAQNKNYPFSGVVLEIKTLYDVPLWMIDLVREFDLVRVGNCKYSTAVWAEAPFHGTPLLPIYGGEYAAP